MSLEVRAATAAEHSWLLDKVGHNPTKGFRAIVAVDGSGLIRGAVGYDGWTEASVQCHMAVDSPIVWRSLAVPAFFYPFEECGKSVLVGVIRANNQPSVEMTRALGFTLCGRVPNGHRVGVDLLIFQMQKAACHWLLVPNKAHQRGGWVKRKTTEAAHA